MTIGTQITRRNARQTLFKDRSASGHCAALGHNRSLSRITDVSPQPASQAYARTNPRGINKGASNHQAHTVPVMRPMLWTEARAAANSGFPAASSAAAHSEVSEYSGMAQTITSTIR